MKLKILTPVASLLGLFLFAGQSARAQFDLGDAANYAVLYEGEGGTLHFNTTINGNIGIGDPSGTTTSQYQPSGGPGIDNGTVSFAGAADVQGSAGSGPTAILSNVTQVQMDLNNLNALSTTLGSQSGASTIINGTTTINASSGALIGGNEVFNVSSFSLGNGQTLTINGNGSVPVVLNFGSSGEHFAGTINLTGGLTANQVLYNLTGGTLQFAANGATEEGTFLDPTGQIIGSSVNIDGHLYGGGSADMQIVSGTNVNEPLVPVPEASNYGFVALCLCGFLMGRRIFRTWGLVQ